MDPILGAAIAGGLIEGGIGALGQHSANRANARLSREQMAWQERMSSTAYQRSVQDMQKAGLNPLYWLKGGASTPGGSVPNIESVTQGVRGTTAKAMEARANIATVANLEAQNQQILSQTAVNLASAKEILARTKKTGADTQVSTFVGSLAKEAEGFVSSAKGAAQSLGSSLGHKLYDFINPNSVPKNMRKK